MNCDTLNRGKLRVRYWSQRVCIVPVVFLSEGAWSLVWQAWQTSNCRRCALVLARVTKSVYRNLDKKELQQNWWICCVILRLSHSNWQRTKMELKQSTAAEASGSLCSRQRQGAQRRGATCHPRRRHGWRAFTTWVFDSHSMDAVGLWFLRLELGSVALPPHVFGENKDVILFVS